MASQVESIKWVPGTSLMVDGFNFQDPSRCQHHFLTHYHSDHTCGLGRPFNSGTGTIYCSHVTADLLVLDMGLDPARVRCAGWPAGRLWAWQWAGRRGGGQR